MNSEDLRAREKACVRGWSATGHELERLRNEAVRHIDAVQAIVSQRDAFEAERWLRSEPQPTSGLVEVQRNFSRARR